MKALLIHLLALGLYILIVMYVVNGEDVDSMGRFLICFVGLIPQIIACGINDSNDYYKK